jgi:hypothetical protein
LRSERPTPFSLCFDSNHHLPPSSTRRVARPSPLHPLEFLISTSSVVWRS